MSPVLRTGRAGWYGPLLMAWCVTTAIAQLPPTLPNPRLNWTFPAGGQVGTTFDFTVTGDDLDEATQLRFDHSGITAKLKTADPGVGQTGPQPAYGSFEITIAPDVEPGVYDVRVISKYGLSTPRAFVVGSLREKREQEPNNLPKQANEIDIDTTVNGLCEQSGHDYYKFTVKKDQRVIIDCQAFRIDSRLDATLILFDSTGKELERSHNVNRRDPLIDFTAPADGEYLVSIHDQSYNYYLFGGECFYRLTISRAPYLDYIFPPAGLPGSSNTYSLFGRNLPGGKPVVGQTVFGRTLETLQVTIPLPLERERDLVREGGRLVEPSESFLDGVTYRLKSPDGLSNPLLLNMAGAPVTLEEEPNNDPAKAPLLKLPCEYVGQFYPRGDRDWVSFQAKKDDVLMLEVFSQRLGSPTDPRMIVQQMKQSAEGKTELVDLATIDDDLGNMDRVHWSMLDSVLYSTQTHDPSYRFVAPEDGTYRVMIQDLSRPTQDLARTSQGDARYVYRLSIRPPQPDFRLVAIARPPTNLPSEHAVSQTVWSPNLRPGGVELIEVYACRRDGFDGDIHVTATNLPAGVTAQSIVIAAKSPSATLVLKAAENAPPGISVISIQGRSSLNQTEVVRSARYGAMTWAVQLTGVTYHRSRLTDQLPVAVIAGEPAPYALQANPDLKLAASINGTVKFSLSAVRRGNFQGPLDLFTFGLPPTIYGPMHAQPKYHVPTTLPANQSSQDFTITVPTNVPPGTYSFFVSGVGTVSYARDPVKLKAHEDRLAAVEKIVAENAVSLKSAQEAQAAAAKALADAQAAQKDAKSLTDAKTAADQAVVAADQKAKQDAAFLQMFRQEVMTLREKSKPTDLKMSSQSNPITLTITPAPVEFQFASNRVAVKQGGKLELPLTIKRLYGFDGPVNFQFQGSYNISGINAPVVTIPAGQSEGKLMIEVQPGAKPDTYASAVIVSMLYNGQTLTLKPGLKFTIEPAAAAQK